MASDHWRECPLSCCFAPREVHAWATARRCLRGVNVELMAREIVGKGVPAEVAALSSADAIVHVLWEDQFNDTCQGHDERNFPACAAP